MNDSTLNGCGTGSKTNYSLEYCIETEPCGQNGSLQINRAFPEQASYIFQFVYQYRKFLAISCHFPCSQSNFPQLLKSKFSYANHGNEICNLILISFKDIPLCAMDDKSSQI